MKTANFSYPNSGLKIPFATDGATTSLPVYGGKVSFLLNPALEFMNDGSYILGIRSIPSTQQQNTSNLIQPNQTYEDNINVPEGSFLTMIGAVGLDGSQTGVMTAGLFRVRIYDVGSQSYLSDDFVHAMNLGGNIVASPIASGQPFDGQQQNIVRGLGSNALNGHGLFILPSPIAVSSPGQLAVQIVNLSNNANEVDMAFYFAIPIGAHQAVSPASISGNFRRTSTKSAS